MCQAVGRRADHPRPHAGRASVTWAWALLQPGLRWGTLLALGALPPLPVLTPPRLPGFRVSTPEGCSDLSTRLDVPARSSDSSAGMDSRSASKRSTCSLRLGCARARAALRDPHARTQSLLPRRAGSPVSALGFRRCQHARTIARGGG